ncbi:RHS repeat protein [Pseudomonas aeruginosa]|nr:RHS repeat protein [Pseudomonas aeruginosa]
MRRTDARGAVTEYRYDALNRLIERHSPSDRPLDVQCRYDLLPTAAGASAPGRHRRCPRRPGVPLRRARQPGRAGTQHPPRPADPARPRDLPLRRGQPTAGDRLPLGLAIGCAQRRRPGRQRDPAVGDKAPSPWSGRSPTCPSARCGA